MSDLPKLVFWTIAVVLLSAASLRPLRSDEPVDVYARICQEYLDGKWDAVNADLRAVKKAAGLGTAQQADLAYIRQTLTECRPAWWAQTKAGQKCAIRPVVWGTPLNLTYDPAGQGGVQVQFSGNTSVLTISWPAKEMDNLDQAEHGFTKGELNNLSVWATLGMAKVWSQTPAQVLVGMSEADKTRLLPCQDFRGNVTGLYYGLPQAPLGRVSLFAVVAGEVREDADGLLPQGGRGNVFGGSGGQSGQVSVAAAAEDARC